MTSSADSDVDVAIVGGGISGLATAWYLRRDRPDLRLVVLESAAQAGGNVGSAELLGVRIDAGPDAFLARVEGGVELAQELGLGDSLVAPATGQAWVWSRGALRALPAGLVLGVPSDADAVEASGILTPEGMRELRRDDALDVHLRAYDLEGADVSVAEGIGAHLGREVVERLVDPLLGGISAASCDALSLRSASPELFEAAGAPRLMAALRSRQTAATRGQIGVTEERPVFLTPRGGVHRIVERLARELAEAVQVDSPVRSVARAAGVWRVSTPHRSFSARQLVFATPAYVSAPLLADVDADLSGELASIRTSSVALVLLAYPSESVTLPPGSGLLVPRPEGRLLTAASWWSQKWPHLEVPGHVVIRASAGRDRDTRFTSLADDELVAALHTDLADMLGLSATPAGSHVARWMRGFPQYDVGHAARVARLEAHASRVGVSLVGASYRGIGLPACIRDAKRTAAALCA